MRISEAQGTIWSGAGWVEIRDPRGRSSVTKRIAWRVLPAWLLRGHLACEIELERSMKWFLVTISPSRTEVADFDIDLPAAVLGLALPRLAPVEFSGELSAHFADFSFARNGMQGDVTVQWRNAGSAFAPVSPLGNYEIRLRGTGTGTEINATLSTSQGPLQLDGKGSWRNGGNPGFLAVARIPPQHREQLAPFLRLIAVERTDGSFELKID